MKVLYENKKDLQDKINAANSMEMSVSVETDPVDNRSFLVAIGGKPFVSCEYDEVLDGCDKVSPDDFMAELNAVSNSFVSDMEQAIKSEAREQGVNLKNGFGFARDAEIANELADQIDCGNAPFSVYPVIDISIQDAFDEQSEYVDGDVIINGNHVPFSYDRREEEVVINSDDVSRDIARLANNNYDFLVGYISGEINQIYKDQEISVVDLQKNGKEFKGEVNIGKSKMYFDADRKCDDVTFMPRDAEAAGRLVYDRCDAELVIEKSIEDKCLSRDDLMR